MAGINAFKQGLLGKFGLSRPTKYVVRIYGPREGVAPIYQPETVTLPSRSLAMVQEHFHGEQWNVPCGRTFDSSLVMTFPVGVHGNERAFFEEWMDQIIDPETNFAISGEENNRKNEYSTSVHVGILNPANDQIVQTYTFFDCFPSSVFPVNYGFNMMNDYARLQVQFEYKRYEFKSEGYNQAGTPFTNIYADTD